MSAVCGVDVSRSPVGLDETVQMVLDKHRVRSVRGERNGEFRGARFVSALRVGEPD